MPVAGALAMLNMRVYRNTRSKAFSLLVIRVSPLNMTGMPAMSIPSGFSNLDIPVGMQWLGKPFDESTMLRAAYTYQQHAKWHERRPPI